METKEITAVVESFASTIEKASTVDNFDDAIGLLCACRDKHINEMEDVVREMKQVTHDLTQDIYNKFKDKNFVKTIKF